jgi:glycosyltransferase involved in cell wall biosynthesis
MHCGTQPSLPGRQERRYHKYGHCFSDGATSEGEVRTVYKGKSIAVIVPAYNEEAFIGSVIATIPDFVDAIVVVDDASGDATAQCVREAGDHRVLLLVNQANAGVGAAMVRGYRKALELQSDVLVKVDGDGQMPLSHLEALLDPVVEGGYGYAKGNRFLDSAALERMPKGRLLGNMALTFLTKLASGYWHVFDPQNGFTAVSKETLGAIDLSRLHQQYFFENDMLVELNIHRVRVKDVPMPAMYGAEESNIRIFSVLLTFPWLFFRRFLRRVYMKYVLHDFSPIALFLSSGGLLVLWGGGFGIYLWIRGIAAHAQNSTGTVMLAALPLILGFQLVLQGLVLDIQETPR